ncbi:hypothetical protein CsatB_010103 [Cannabis sativa]
MERWIIVSVSDYASDLLRKLVKIKGWQVLTIGNSKTRRIGALKFQVAEELFTSLSVVGERLDSTRCCFRWLFVSLSVVGEMLDSTRCCCLVAVRFAFSRRRKARLHFWIISIIIYNNICFSVGYIGEEGSSVSTINLFSSRVFQRRGAMGSARGNWNTILYSQHVAKKAFDPISILLSSLVAKGLISA